MTQEAVSVLVAASGSGGHLYPARLIIEALQAEGATVSFVGSGRPLEETIIAPTGIPRFAIDTSGIKNLGIKGLFKFLISLPGAISQTLGILKKVRPDVVIGVGGYATFLPVSLARLKGIPQWIHEAERNPGLANYVLSFYTRRVSLAFPDAKMPSFARTVFTGHPVRKELRSLFESSDQLEKGRKNILILGGSQGAKALDEAGVGLKEYFAAHHLSVWHQCRPENEVMVRDAYQEAGVDARVMPFIDALHEAYQWADLIVSRSGAGAVMEIGVVNIPTIFVPFPYAQGDHQTANARLLVDQGKAVLVKEGDDFVERLQIELEKLLTTDAYDIMREKECEFRKLDAADMIAREAIALSA